jgi:phage-related protein
MIDRNKKLRARFYETISGRKPVREWLLELNVEDRRIVGYDIETVEFGWPIGMPVCRPLGDGLWEVRSQLTDNKIGRVIFCMLKDDMVLLHGFIKKTQKTPQQEIQLAAKRRKDIA